VLVLGLGNRLLGDDAVGLELAAAIRRLRAGEERIEVVDGGTQGLALLGRLEGREALLVLDAFAGGERAGTVHRVDDPLAAARERSFGAHGSTAGELLAAARLTGVLPEEVTLVGIEPGVVETHIGLSREVREALPLALEVAFAALERMLGPVESERVGEEQPCTS